MESTTHVIHNAWAVNFNLPLQAFEAQITGVRKLIEASASAARPMKLLVSSSIGVTRGHNPADGPVPEQLMGDPGVATSNGYTASKYVVEEVSKHWIFTRMFNLNCFLDIDFASSCWAWSLCNVRTDGAGMRT